MIPILYEKDASAFDNNGIGVLKDAVSCIVTEERNGEYTCTLQYPITGNWYGKIAEGSIIKAKANETSNPQLFRISKSSKPIKGIVTFSANHISYDLSGLPLMSLAQTNKTAQAAMTAGFSACPLAHGFTAWSDKTVLESVNIAAPRSLRNFIGGQEGSILALYGGELEFDNFTVKLHVNRGADNGVTIAYGKNLTDAKQDKNIEAAYTHLCPYAVKTVNTYNDDGEIIAQTEELVKLTENVIPLYDPVPYSKALIMDFTDEFSDDEEINETNLRTKANAYISSHELTAPEVNLTVSFIQIWDTPEYKDFAALERVKLCDTVTVRYSELGINVKAKVVKTVYDSLKERYNSILIGSARANLANTVLNINDRIEEDKKAAENDKKSSDVDLHNAIIDATNKITGNAGGYVVLYPANYPEEILIMNTNNKSTATKVWRWNASGLGYSSTGYNGPFGIAMTADGQIVADYISTGTLSAISISGCTISGGTLNIGSGKFEVDSSGNIHAEGYIKATSGVIGGCTITNGALDVPAANISGVLTIGQLPNTVAEISDIPTNVSQLNNDAGYENSSGVVTIIDGRVTAAYVEALSISVGAAQITGQLTAAQINANGITAANVDISGQITATSGVIGDETYNFTIGSSGTSASIYCGTSSLIKWLYGVSYNNVYIGTDGLSYSYVDTSGGYNELQACTIRGGSLQTFGTNQDHENVSIKINAGSIRFFNAGTNDLMNANNPFLYEVGAIELTQQYSPFLTGMWKSLMSIQVVSDKRKKSCIENIDSRYVDLIDNLTPCRYKLNDDKTGRYHTGFIAQDVKAALEAAGLTPGELAALDCDGDMWGLRYEELIAPMIAKIKALEKRILALEK